MKANTDIKQGQVLAKILPLESADMALCSKIQPLMTDYISAKKKFSNAGEIPIDPCWSLSALVNVLPRIDIEKEIWSSEKYDYRVKAFIGDGYVSDWYDNPIDACYEMILKLEESNLLKFK